MSQLLRTSARAELVDTDLGSREVILQRPSFELTRNVTPKVSNILAVTTSEAALPLGGVTNCGFAVLENLETNEASATYISVGFTVSATFYESHRIPPKGVETVWLSPSRTWQAKTNTSTGSLKYTICERNA